MAVTRLVLDIDASFALEVLLPSSEKCRLEAFGMLAAIAAGDLEARVPWVFFAELAQVVTKSVRAKRVDVDVDAGAVFLARIDAIGL